LPSFCKYPSDLLSAAKKDLHSNINYSVVEDYEKFCFSFSNLSFSNTWNLLTKNSLQGESPVSVGWLKKSLKESDDVFESEGKNESNKSKSNEKEYDNDEISSDEDSLLGDVISNAEHGNKRNLNRYINFSKTTDISLSSSFLWLIGCWKYMIITSLYPGKDELTELTTSTSFDLEDSDIFITSDSYDPQIYKLVCESIENLISTVMPPPLLFSSNRFLLNGLVNAEIVGNETELSYLSTINLLYPGSLMKNSIKGNDGGNWQRNSLRENPLKEMKELNISSSENKDDISDFECGDVSSVSSKNSSQTISSSKQTQNTDFTFGSSVQTGFNSSMSGIQKNKSNSSHLNVLNSKIFKDKLSRSNPVALSSLQSLSSSIGPLYYTYLLATTKVYDKTFV
jgi:hypothetical protein